MAKLVEQVKTYDEEIKIGDLVKVMTSSYPDPICIVTGVNETPTDGGGKSYLYQCVDLTSGIFLENILEKLIIKYHRTITLSNE